MTPWKARNMSVVIAGVVVLAGLLTSRLDLWSGSLKPSPRSPRDHSGFAIAGSSGAGEAESLQEAFIRVAEQVGPAVVSISTEQVERVRQYLRGQPFFGGPSQDPFEEFFRQFYGEVPGRELRRFGLGSGVIIDAQGLILTNEHVVADADKITVTLSDGKEFIGHITGKDARSDLAVIKIESKKPLPSAKAGDSSTVKAGQWAIALGNPFGLMGAGISARATGSEPTLTVGVISATDRQLPLLSNVGRGADRDYSGLIQTDAAINPGNSGGPLLNLQGEIIGINVAILTSSRGYEGIGFAIPVNKAKRVINALVEGKPVVYGWLGIQIQDITDDVAEYYHFTDRDGVLVYQVVPGSPAQDAGLQIGDVIKTLNGERIHHAREIIDRVSTTKAGEQVRLELLREGKPMAVQVTIGKRPADVVASLGEATVTEWRGLKVAALTLELAERSNLPAATAGVRVLEVEEGSPAEHAGLRPGDIINEVSSRDQVVSRVHIENLADYHRAVAQVRGDALVRTSRGYVVIKAGSE